MTESPNKSEGVLQLLKTGMAPMAIAKQVGCTPGLVYNIKSSMGLTKARGAKSSPAGKPRANSKIAATSASGDIGMSSLLDAVRRTERDRASLRATLERLAQVVGDALA